MISQLVFLAAFQSDVRSPSLSSGGLEGYIGMAVPAPPDEFGYGVSLYSTAWPLLERPLRDFQIGLASIWIIPENRKIEYPLLPHGTVARDNWPERGPSYRDVFQTIEGGLGFWASTHFGSSTAKFRMNGTANGYNNEISSPGWGFGNTSPLKPDQMGIAQLSSRILVPPDGLTFRKDTVGDLLGYAWMALPFTRPKETPVKTGNQCWTMFLNTKNFRGPVAFYIPSTWSQVSQNYPPAVARGLDARPGLVTGGAIEINTVPRFVGHDAAGTVYTKIPRLQFPADKDGRTVLIHNLTHYSKDALYNQVERWLDGGPAPLGKFDDKGAIMPTCKANPLIVRQGPDKLIIKGCNQWVETATVGNNTFSLHWKPEVLESWTKGQRKGSFPEYFKQEGKQMLAITSDKLPEETGLKAAQFQTAVVDNGYISPDNKDDCWHKPGPTAGPFQAKLTDGSIVTYYWYRFIDQPTCQNAGLDPAEKARLQGIAEKIQANWTPQKQYLPPPTTGTLSTIDPALIVKPPKGLEVGYVPIVTKQAPP